MKDLEATELLYFKEKNGSNPIETAKEELALASVPVHFLRSVNFSLATAVPCVTRTIH